MLRQGLQEEEQADNTVVQGIYKLPRAAIINPHELGCLNNRNTLPHNSEAGGPRSRAWQGECLPRVMRDNLFQVSARFLWFADHLWQSLTCRSITPDFYLHLHMAFSLCLFPQSPCYAHLSWCRNLLFL